jgi:hypothetical protein
MNTPETTQTLNFRDREYKQLDRGQIGEVAAAFDECSGITDPDVYMATDEANDQYFLIDADQKIHITVWPEEGEQKVEYMGSHEISLPTHDLFDDEELQAEMKRLRISAMPRFSTYNPTGQKCLVAAIYYGSREALEELIRENWPTGCKADDDDCVSQITERKTS